jgi:hypothetical protein
VRRGSAGELQAADSDSLNSITNPGSSCAGKVDNVEALLLVTPMHGSVGAEMIPLIEQTEMLRPHGLDPRRALSRTLGQQGPARWHHVNLSAPAASFAFPELAALLTAHDVMPHGTGDYRGAMLMDGPGPASAISEVGVSLSVTYVLGFPHFHTSGICPSAP